MVEDEALVLAREMRLGDSITDDDMRGDGGVND